MVARFLVALLVLFFGAIVGALLAMVASNGYGTAGIDENLLAVSYLVLGAGGTLLLAWICAALAGKLSARLGWRTWITLPLVLLPALFVEIFGLIMLAVVLGELLRAV